MSNVVIILLVIMWVTLIVICAKGIIKEIKKPVGKKFKK